MTRATRLNQIRRICRLSQADFGRRLGVSQSAVSAYEGSKREVPDYVLRDAWRLAARVRAELPETTTDCAYQVRVDFDGPTDLARHMEICPHCLKLAYESLTSP